MLNCGSQLFFEVKNKSIKQEERELAESLQNKIIVAVEMSHCF